MPRRRPADSVDRGQVHLAGQRIGRINTYTYYIPFSGTRQVGHPRPDGGIRDLDDLIVRINDLRVEDVTDPVLQ